MMFSQQKTIIIHWENKTFTDKNSSRGFFLQFFQDSFKTGFFILFSHFFCVIILKTPEQLNKWKFLLTECKSNEFVISKFTQKKVCRCKKHETMPEIKFFLSNSKHMFHVNRKNNFHFYTNVLPCLELEWISPKSHISSEKENLWWKFIYEENVIEKSILHLENSV